MTRGVEREGRRCFLRVRDPLTNGQAATFPQGDLSYAFASIRNGRCSIGDEPSSREKLRQLSALKAKHPRLRTLISIGGWTGSGPFSDTAATPESRATFAGNSLLPRRLPQA